MSIAPSTHDASRCRTGGEPPLENGDHLSRADFERRWEAMPELKKAELIDGVVFMSAAVRDDVHGEPHGLVMAWLVNYALMTPGVKSADNSSVRMDDDNMPQPDGCLRLPPQLGSTALRANDGYLQGAPDLVAEVSASSASIDLHRKLDVYREHGVREYVVWRTIDEEVDWFVLRDKEYVRLELDEQGWYKSELFPGLWLHPQILLYGFPTAIHGMFHTGMQGPEHAAFVAHLQASLGSKPA